MSIKLCVHFLSLCCCYTFPVSIDYLDFEKYNNVKFDGLILNRPSIIHTRNNMINAGQEELFGGYETINVKEF